MWVVYYDLLYCHNHSNVTFNLKIHKLLKTNTF